MSRGEGDKGREGERERGGERRRNGQLGNFFFSLRGTFNKDKNLMEEKRTVIARIIVAF